MNTNYYNRTAVDASFALKTYVDGSLNTNYYTSTAIDSSMNTNFYNRTAVDASFALKTYVDGSLNDNYYTRTAIDSSMNTSFYNRTAVDASFALKTYVDGSLNTNYYTRTAIDSSMNTNFYNKTYIDASFSNIVTNSLTTTGSGTITAGGGFIGTSFQPSANTTAIAFANITTTGNIDIGGQQSTGNLNLGIGARSATGNINIGGVSAGSSTNAINIGTGSGSTNTINIGQSNVISIVNSATPTFTINRPILATGNPSSSTTAIGYIPAIVSTTSGTVGPPSASTTWTFSTGIMTLGTGVWLVSLHAAYTASGISLNTTFVWNMGLMTTAPTIGNSASASKAPNNTLGGLNAWIGNSDGVNLDNGSYGQQFGGVVLNNYDGTYNTLYGIFNWYAAAGTLNTILTLRAVKIA